ncbi:MAG: TIGR03960 family B12-binding radical SAM protein [Syntrophobacterales bacterium]|nr:MAG: TIGR03960 family B12-binding radical SAM protein [Syntrophobacterales bacterium]
MSWKLIQRAKKRLSEERGTIRKEWAARTSLCLAFPNRYYTGMSNLGFQSLYRQLNQLEDIVCERVFLPDREELPEYRKTDTALFSLESQRPLYDFDILAFSIPFENDYLNILTLLEMGKIPLLRTARNETHPLVIAGGVAVFLNPEPLSDFFHVFLVGEGEELLPEFLRCFQQAKSEGNTRRKFLEKAAAIEGAYVPQFYQVRYLNEGPIKSFTPKGNNPSRIKRRWVRDLNHIHTASTLFTPHTEFNDMALVEVNRGCSRRCRFCAGCFIYRPFRNRSLEVLIKDIQEGLTRERRIGLVGSAVSDHPHLRGICQSVLDLRGTLSIASLRVDSISADLIRYLKAGGHKTISLAPEAGSERLRRVINKDLQEEDLLRAVETIVKTGIPNIRLYFIIGLPTEKAQDIDEIVGLTRRIKHIFLKVGRDRKRLGRITLSISPFVPKPSTPFQWVPYEEINSLKRKLKLIKNELRGEGNVHVIHDLPKWGYIQTLLSRGDRRVGKILLGAHYNDGNWRKTFKEINLNPDFYVYRERELDEILPWDFIDHGIDRDYLRKEYLEALSEAKE